MRTKHLLGAMVALALAATPLAITPAASASTYKCTSVLYTPQQCIRITGSGLHVDDLKGEIWLFNDSLRGTFQMRLRTEYPNGSIAYKWGGKKYLSCFFNDNTWHLCWSYDFGAPIGSQNYPNNTVLCTATYRVNSDGSRSFVR